MPGGVDNGDAESHIHLEALDNTAQGVEGAPEPGIRAVAPSRSKACVLKGTHAS